MGAGAKLFLIGWRILFVTLYWFVMLAIAGITVAGARVVGVVGTAIALISSIISLVSNLLEKR